MPEYIYLLETRLSAAQQNALTQIREAAREAGLTVFLAGGAVRDLTTGSSVRDLDFSVQGDALQLQRGLEARGGTLWGKHEPSRTLFFWFPGSVRIEITSTRSEIFPKPGQPVYTWSSIVADLHRRDFTANAMAISLNEGSYGLLLDPLNGVADIDARQLRLVSNYGFLEDPSRLVRAVRLAHRLGWLMEEKTAVRYQNAKEADNFSAISAYLRGYELEKIACEDEGLATVKALEAEGWMQKLCPAWTSASADTPALQELHRNRIQLLMQGVSPDLAACHLELLTAKMSADARKTLKSMLVRPGLVAQWEGLDAAAKEFARLLTSKDMAAPSATWKLFHSHPAEPILWLAHAKKSAPVETKFRNFFTVWPEIAKKVPVALMMEMRITPELPIYEELLHQLFLQQLDEKLETDELMRAFLEAYSPPAPPPPVTLKRSRAKKADAKGKKKSAGRDADDDADEDDDTEPKARRGGGEDDEDDDSSVGDADEDGDEGDEDHAMELPARIAKPLNLDAVDLKAVLGKIDSSDSEDDEADDEIDAVNDAENDADEAESDGEDEPDSGGKPKVSAAARAGAASRKSAATPASKPSVPARPGDAAKPAAPVKKAVSGAAAVAQVPTTASTKPEQKQAKAGSQNAARPAAHSGKAVAVPVRVIKKTAVPPVAKPLPQKKPATKAASPARTAPASVPVKKAAAKTAKPVPQKAAPAATALTAKHGKAKAPAKVSAKAVPVKKATAAASKKAPTKVPAKAARKAGSSKKR